MSAPGFKSSLSLEYSSLYSNCSASYRSKSSNNIQFSLDPPEWLKLGYLSRFLSFPDRDKTFSKLFSVSTSRYSLLLVIGLESPKDLTLIFEWNSIVPLSNPNSFCTIFTLYRLNSFWFFIFLLFLFSYRVQCLWTLSKRPWIFLYVTVS